MMWYPNLVFVSGETVGFEHVEGESLKASVWNGSCLRKCEMWIPIVWRFTYDHGPAIHPTQASSSCNETVVLNKAVKVVEAGEAYLSLYPQRTPELLCRMVDVPVRVVSGFPRDRWSMQNGNAPLR